MKIKDHLKIAIDELEMALRKANNLKKTNGVLFLDIPAKRKLVSTLFKAKDLYRIYFYADNDAINFQKEWFDKCESSVDQHIKEHRKAYDNFKKFLKSSS